MFSYLKGILTEKKSAIAVIECMGVGYEIHIPLSTFEKLPLEGNKAKLYIYYSFNETDGAKLFGFSSRLEKKMFKLLISISKIGPKIGLAILSGLPTQDFIRAILQEDIYVLSTIPGIGKKSAERLVIELKDKVPDLLEAGDVEGISQELGTSAKDAETALLSLGYKHMEIRKAINSLLKDKSFNSSEELIKATIKSLYNKRS